MANQNPIYLDEPPVETEFIIPKEYNKTMISLTLEIQIKENDWVYASAHSIYLDFQNCYPQKTPEPVDLILNYGSILENQLLSMISHVSRIKPSGGASSAPKVNYILSIKGGDKLIDSFEKESGTDNPSDFKSLIKFKLLE